jgi:polysaccharide deacetylase 2 family uncharacterized protein YibQ
VLNIDDLGYHYGIGMDMVALPGKVNLAVLPHTPHSTRLAQAGHRAGKEIMLHAPMSNSGGMPLGPGGLTPTLTEEAFARILEEDIDAIPHVRGINNHMGSELTTMPQQMAWVMATLLRRELYFVDSRTSPQTIAGKTAEHFAVPYLSRSVFLDNEPTEEAISRQFQTLVNRAERKGLAVGIGHPYAATADYLKTALPALRCRGIRLALVSEVLQETGDLPDTAAPPLDDYSPTSEPDFNTVLGHISLGLGDRVLPEMENTGGENGIGTTQGNSLYQMIQVTHPP